MKKLYYIFGFIGLITLIQCTQKKANPIGSEYFDNQDLAEVKHQTFYASSTDTSFYVPAQNGTGEFLYMGTMGDIHAGSFIRFTDIEDTSDIDSAVVLLKVYRIENNNDIPAEINVYKITSSWDDLTMTSDDFDATMIGDCLGSIHVSSDSTDSLFFKLDPELVSLWMDTTTSDANYGLYLDSENDFMLNCYSRDISSETGAGPELLLYFTEDSTRYPENYESTNDIFIADSKTQPNDIHLIIESGTAYRSFLEFDLSSFVPNAIINRAIITLTADTMKTLPLSDKSKGLTACYLDSAFDDLTTVECESQNSSTGIFKEGKGTIYFTFQIQEIISDQLDNMGFLIKGQYEFAELSRMVFYSQAADSSLQPRLDVTYTLPPVNQL
ncbi:DNRLRE domain-containing protein [bacterium]|nr:DNRLRE domain-containing protein [bacterium]